MNKAAQFRLLKFSVVGALGICVQASVLAALVATRMDYLLATAFAVECAIVHNCLCHCRFTWADRSRSGGKYFIASLWRFHLSNGLISLVGNVILMRLLVGIWGFPVLPANIATISACFLANFLASDRWVFSSPASE